MSEIILLEKQIKQLVNNSKKSAEKIFDEFFDIYEPIFFSHNEMIDGLSSFDSPFKELIAAHQAWGMIGSDGFGNYFDATSNQFDHEVRRGLRLLGCEICYRALSEARELYMENNCVIPEEDDDRLFNQFYYPIEKFETMAGLYLIQKFKKA